MNDLKPYKHGDEGKGSTHMCCKTRLKKMGSKATCCICDPHLPCDFRDTHKILRSCKCDICKKWFKYHSLPPRDRSIKSKIF